MVLRAKMIKKNRMRFCESYQINQKRFLIKTQKIAKQIRNK